MRNPFGFGKENDRSTSDNLTPEYRSDVEGILAEWGSELPLQVPDTILHAYVCGVLPKDDAREIERLAGADEGLMGRIEAARDVFNSPVDPKILNRLTSFAAEQIDSIGERAGTTQTGGKAFGESVAEAVAALRAIRQVLGAATSTRGNKAERTRPTRGRLEVLREQYERLDRKQKPDLADTVEMKILAGETLEMLESIQTKAENLEAVLDLLDHGGVASDER